MEPNRNVRRGVAGPVGEQVVRPSTSSFQVMVTSVGSLAQTASKEIELAEDIRDAEQKNPIDRLEETSKYGPPVRITPNTFC